MCCCATGAREHPSRHSLDRVRKKQLFAAYFVAGNCALTGWRGDPIDKLLSLRRLHMRMPDRIHQHDTVLIEEPLVTLDQHFQVAPVLEVELGAAVGQHIGVGAGCHVERRAHATAAGFVAAALLVRQVSHLPESQLGGVGAAFVAA